MNGAILAKLPGQDSMNSLVDRKAYHIIRSWYGLVFLCGLAVYVFTGSCIKATTSIVFGWAYLTIIFLSALSQKKWKKKRKFKQWLDDVISELVRRRQKEPLTPNDTKTIRRILVAKHGDISNDDFEYFAYYAWKDRERIHHEHGLYIFGDVWDEEYKEKQQMIGEENQVSEKEHFYNLLHRVMPRVSRPNEEDDEKQEQPKRGDRK